MRVTTAAAFLGVLLLLMTTLVSAAEAPADETPSVEWTLIEDGPWADYHPNTLLTSVVPTPDGGVLIVGGPFLQLGPASVWHSPDLLTWSEPALTGGGKDFDFVIGMTTPWGVSVVAGPGDVAGLWSSASGTEWSGPI